MSIIKRVRNREYTQAPNKLINDKRLSAEGLGMLLYLLSKPHNWKIITSQLSERFDIGKDKTHKIMRELRECGYSTREFERNENGHIVGQFIVIYDEPLADEDADAPPSPERAAAHEADSFVHRKPENPAAVNPAPVKPAPVNPAAVVKKDTNKPPPTSPPSIAASAERDEDGGSAAEEKGIGPPAETSSRTEPEPAPAVQAAALATREEKIGEGGQTVFDKRLDVEDEFEELWRDWKLRNPKYRDDALDRFKRLTLEERAQARSRAARSEERRVGKECRSRWSPYH